jgi:hypothetical protein
VVSSRPYRLRTIPRRHVRDPTEEDPIADDPLPLLLIAGSRLAGQPGVTASELDPLVRRLTRLDPGVDSDGHAQRALTGLLPPLWEGGWQPADLVHAVRRRTSQRGARLVAAAIRADATASGAADRAPAAWVAQLVAVSTGATSVAEWWRAEQVAAADAWRDVLRVLGVVRDLPPLELLLPPPAAWSLGSRLEPGIAAGADPKLLGRIRALLAKAESTDFVEEAEAFTAKAQSLMARHAIDTAVLAQRPGAPRTPVTARRLHLEDPHLDAKAAVVQAVGSANGVRVVLVPALGMATLVGLADDLDVVELLVTSLLLQAGRAMNAATRGGGSRVRSTAYRRGFLYAFAQRIGERLAGERDQATEEAAATYGEALLPVLAARERAVADAVSELFPRLSQRTGRTVDAAGWYAGRQAADDADLGTRQRPLAPGAD